MAYFKNLVVDGTLDVRNTLSVGNEAFSVETEVDVKDDAPAAVDMEFNKDNNEWTVTRTLTSAS